MRIAPMMEEYGQDIHHVLQQDPDNFPYEYYSVQFSTFSGGHFAGFRRYLRHLFLDSARIDNEHAALGVYAHSLQRQCAGGRSVPA